MRSQGARFRPADCSFAEVIDRAATAAERQQNSLSDGRSTLAYQALPEGIAKIGAYLAENGIKPAHCIALECANSLPGALTLLYLLQQGYRFLLLPPSAPRAVENDPGPLVPAFCHYKLKVKSALSTGTAAPDEKRVRATVGPTGRLCTDFAQQERIDRPETFLQIEANNRRVPGSVSGAGVGPVLLLRTSGSLGSPKIAIHPHAGLLDNALNCIKPFSIEPGDRVFIPVPIFHMYGLGAGFIPALAAGASIDLQENTNILRYLARERQFNPTIAFLTPALCEMLVKARKSDRVYKTVVTAGDRIKTTVFTAFESRFGRLINLYGSTEMGAIATSDPGDVLDVRATSAVKPLPGVQLRVEEQGGAGELLCQHPYGFAGYIDENGTPAGQDTAFQSGWFRTGDLGRINLEGYVELLGRCDHSVNRAGRLVLFADIEKTMETFEGIERIVVVQSGESKWGGRIVAYCVPQAATTLDAGKVRAACFDRLPRYAVPDDVVVLDALPTLPNGKVDRPALVRLAVQATASTRHDD